MFKIQYSQDYDKILRICGWLFYDKSKYSESILKEELRRYKNGENSVGVGVGVVIIDANKILLGLRTDSDKYDPTKLRQMNTWTMPSGKL